AAPAAPWRSLTGEADPLSAAHAARHLNRERAGGARVGITHRDAPAPAMRRFFQRHRQVRFLIAAAKRWLRPTASARATRAARGSPGAREAAANAEELLEEVAEVAQIAELRRAGVIAFAEAERFEPGRRRAMRLRLLPGGAVAIVAGAFRRILQD